MAIDLREPVPLRVLTFNAFNHQIGEVVIGDDEPVISPEQAASMALHADGVVRAQVLDLADPPTVLLDRSKDRDGHGYLDA